MTTIDPETITLALEGEVGVFPLRWSHEDVGTPFEGELCDCHDLNDDGFMDLALKFNKQEVVSAIGDVNDEDIIELTVSGNLDEDEGSIPLNGQDCVVIRKK